MVFRQHVDYQIVMFPARANDSFSFSKRQSPVPQSPAPHTEQRTPSPYPVTAFSLAIVMSLCHFLRHCAYEENCLHRLGISADND